MSVTKMIISKKISKDVGLTQKESISFLEAFISILKMQSKKNKIKISNFGSFQVTRTLKRIGRNPKTKESYIIIPREKLNFIGSNVLRKFLNP